MDQDAFKRFLEGKPMSEAMQRLLRESAPYCRNCGNGELARTTHQDGYEVERCMSCGEDMFLVVPPEYGNLLMPSFSYETYLRVLGRGLDQPPEVPPLTSSGG